MSLLILGCSGSGRLEPSGIRRYEGLAVETFKPFRTCSKAGLTTLCVFFELFIKGRGGGGAFVYELFIGYGHKYPVGNSPLQDRTRILRGIKQG